MVRREVDNIASVIVDAIDYLASGAPGVRRWWEDLVLPAKELGKAYTTGDLSAYPEHWRSIRPYAYLAFFAPRYFPRLRHAFQAAGLKLAALVRLTEGSIRVLDLGAGSGILTVATLLELERACQTLGLEIRVEAVLQDNDQTALQAAGQLLEFARKANAWPHLQVEWNCRLGDLCDVAPGLFDIVLVGHVICEFYQWKASMDRVHFQSILKPFFKRIEDQLSRCGVAVIIEPMNKTHLLEPLWIRDYARTTSKLGFCAPCLGRGERCPEESAPYNRTPACSGSTHVVSWDDRTSAGHRLRLFTEAVMLTRGISGVRLPLRPSYFFPLVLSRGRPEPVPIGVGMVVRRVGPNDRIHDTEVFCVVRAEGQEQVETIAKPGSRADRAVLRAVDLRDGAPTDFDLSALYPSGWPVNP
jgi:hypothetical protein